MQLKVIRPGLYGSTYRNVGDVIEEENERRAKQLIARDDCEAFEGRKKKKPAKSTDNDGQSPQPDGDEPPAAKKPAAKKPTRKKPTPKTK